MSCVTTFASSALSTLTPVVLPVPLPGGMELVRPALRHAVRWSEMASDPAVTKRMALDGATPSLFRTEVYPLTRSPVFLEDLALDGWGVADLAIQDTSGLLLGTFRVHTETPVTHPGVAVEYALVPSARGRSLASLVVPHAVTWVRDTFGVAHVFAECDSDNLPSGRVLERSGLRSVGQESWCSCG